MNLPFLDIVVAKEYQTNQNGQAETKTAWNRVGRAWTSKNGEAMNFELFMLPGLMYSIQFNPKPKKQETP